MEKTKKCAKIIVFLLIAVVLFIGVNAVVRPIWTEYNNYNTTHGFYEEPENTIETLFLGSSVIANGIIPMELYENYGICAYNLGTTSQPMLASYYWLEEVYRLHQDTLDTVVLDVSMLRRSTTRANYIKALDGMRFSSVKYHAIRDYTENPIEFLSFLIPVMSFHDRWKELTKEDFAKIGYSPETYARGYHFTMDQRLDSVESYADLGVPAYMVDEEDEKELNANAVSYLERMIEFCEERNITLVLIKTEMGEWTSGMHNATQAIADEYGLDFLDFNFYPLVNEVDYNFATDSIHSLHLNYYGATSLTDYMGEYLIEECGNLDVRGDENYSFMEEELADFHRDVISADLGEIVDPGDYLSRLMAQEDYTVFLSVQEDAAESMTEQQRDVFASLGLEQLSDLEYRDSYLAVIDDGVVVTEQIGRDSDFSEEDRKLAALSYSGRIARNISYTLKSGGYHAGSDSSIVIEDEEYAKNSRGLNIVVYDKKLKKVVDTAVFDMHSSSERMTAYYKEALENALENGISPAELSGKLRELYLYNRICEDNKVISTIKQKEGQTGMLSYLQAYWNDEEYDVYISVKEDAAPALTDEVRDIFRDKGLVELADLEEGDSYLAVIHNGMVQEEERNHGESVLETSGITYKVVSGGRDAGSLSSILINGKECSTNENGFNIVIYDTVTDTVVDTVSFGTGVITQTVP